MAITSTDNVLGFLGLIINNSSYIALSVNTNSFVPPYNPGQTPPESYGLTSANIPKGTHRYYIMREEYRTFREFQIILVSIITNNCPDKYITTRKDPITFFCHYTPIQLLKNLWDEYGTITSQDFTKNTPV